jgi:hypothetical protein
MPNLVTVLASTDRASILHLLRHLTQGDLRK